MQNRNFCGNFNCITSKRDQVSILCISPILEEKKMGKNGAKMARMGSKRGYLAVSGGRISGDKELRRDLGQFGPAPPDVESVAQFG